MEGYAELEVESWKDGISLTQKMSVRDYVGLSLATTYFLTIAIASSVLASTSGSGFAVLAILGFVSALIVGMQMVYRNSVRANEDGILLSGALKSKLIKPEDIISISQQADDPFDDNPLLVKHSGGVEAVLFGLSQEAMKQAIADICHAVNQQQPGLEAIIATDLFNSPSAVV